MQGVVGASLVDRHLSPELTISVLLLFHNGHLLPEQANATVLLCQHGYFGDQSGSAWGLGLVTPTDGICTRRFLAAVPTREITGGHQERTKQPPPRSAGSFFWCVHPELGSDQFGCHCTPAQSTTRCQGVKFELTNGWACRLN